MVKSERPSVAQNQRGQGLIEYLIIVALMGVATIAIMRTMSEAVSGRFATITHALQGDKKSIRAKVEESAYKKKDMGNFFDGVGSTSSSGANTKE